MLNRMECERSGDVMLVYLADLSFFKRTMKIVFTGRTDHFVGFIMSPLNQRS